MLGTRKIFGKTELSAAEVKPQNLIVHGYKESTRRTYFFRLHRDSQLKKTFVAYDKSNAVQEFLAHGRIDLGQISPKQLIERITKLQQSICNSNAFISLDCAFTYQGLKELKMQDDLLKVFRLKSRAFYEGAYLRASDHLNDTDASAPADWANAYQEEENNAVDIVLIAHFEATCTSSPPYTAPLIQSAPALLHDFEASLLKHIFEFEPMGPPDPSRTGIDPAVTDWMEESIPIDFKGSIYFGYKDGITTPIFSRKGQKLDASGHSVRHAMGEILLGFPRNKNDNPYSELPLYPSASSSGGIGIALGALTEQEKHHLDFFYGSTFGVFRKMQQRENIFDQWVQQRALQLAKSGTEIPKWTAWIKNKLLGRVSSTIPPNGRGFRGDHGGFNDKNGVICPFGSHIRRMNPRDDPVTPFIARPLLRRGMTYQTQNQQNGEQEVGLSGLFLCADITEQFEHLVGKWANGRVLGVDTDPDNRDPLIGNHQASDHPFLINQDAHGQNKIRLTNPATPFVVTRGTLYAWFPTQSVLKKLTTYLA